MIKDFINQLQQLVKHSIELAIEKRWLKLIDKECNKYNKLSKELEAQNILVNLLIDQYKLIYKKDLRGSK
jgi:hypothetical protein